MSKKRDFKVVSQTVSIPLEFLKGNSQNPRKISDQNRRRLERDIKKDIEYLKLRPVIAYEDPKEPGHYVVYCGNMRLTIAQTIGMEDLPVNIDDDVIGEDGTLNEQLMKERLFRDNEAYGETDMQKMQEFGLVDFVLTLDLPSITKEAEQFMKQQKEDMEFNSIDDTNCEMPIVPQFSEKYSAFIIVVENETDETWIRQNLGFDRMKSYKTKTIAPTYVIPFKQFHEIWTENSNQSQS